MGHDQVLVAEHGDAGDGVHVLAMHEVHELGHVVNVNLVLAEQRMLIRNVDAAIGILDIEDDGIAADFAPMLNDADAVIAGGHNSSEVDGAYFEIPGNGDGVLDDRRRENAGDDDLLVGFKDVRRLRFVIDGADRVGEFGRRQIRGPTQVVMGDCGDGFSALGGIDFGAGSGQQFRLGNGSRFRVIRYFGCDWLELRSGLLLCGWFYGLRLYGEVRGGMWTESPGSGAEQKTGNSRDNAKRRSAQSFLPKTCSDCDSRVGLGAPLVTCGVTPCEF